MNVNDALKCVIVIDTLNDYFLRISRLEIKKTHKKIERK
jgi:hypothetical protein